MSAANTGTPVRGELLGEHLQGAGLARAGRAGDEPVPVHHRERDADLRLGHGVAVDERADFEHLALERVAGADGGDLVRAERCGRRGP